MSEDHHLTIEQLAAETGLTVRNIRSHRARGLLQPPVVRERVGFYGAEHVARLQLVQRLQAEGFNLAGIAKVIESSGSHDGVLAAMHAAAQPFETEQPQVFTRSELRERFRLEDPGPVLSRAEALGVLVPVDEERYEARAPSLLDVAEELVELGVPLHHALAVVAKVRDGARDIARAFIRLFVDDVLSVAVREGMPAERWPEVAGAIERLRPLSAQVVLATYQLTMSDEVEEAIPREVEKLLKKRRR